MKITLEINDLDYGALVAALLPAVHEKLEKEDGSVMNKILGKLTALSPSVAEKMVNLLPKDTQNEIAVLLINKNQNKIIEFAEKLADENDVPVRVSNLEAQL